MKEAQAIIGSATINVVLIPQIDLAPSRNGITFVLTRGHLPVNKLSLTKILPIS